MIVANSLSRKYQCDSSGNKEFISVDNVSFTLLPNSSYSLVGESGSGKSTLSLMLSAILPPSEGTIYFNNKDIWKMNKKELLAMRKDIQLVLQDSSGALNPRDRKSTRLNSSHANISYAVFCLQKQSRCCLQPQSGIRP